MYSHFARCAQPQLDRKQTFLWGKANVCYHFPCKIWVKSVIWIKSVRRKMFGSYSMFGECLGNGRGEGKALSQLFGESRLPSPNEVNSKWLKEWLVLTCYLEKLNHSRGFSQVTVKYYTFEVEDFWWVNELSPTKLRKWWADSSHSITFLHSPINGIAAIIYCENEFVWRYRTPALAT